MKGEFKKFFQPYEIDGNEVASTTQARNILKHSVAAVNSFKGVAIIYSANYDQTLKIRQTYSEGDWKIGVSGGNQAKVISEVEVLLDSEFSQLQSKFQVAPITTMSYSGFHGQSHREVLEADLLEIEKLLEEGWMVFGWINDLSKHPVQYAIGGGISGDAFPKALYDLCQETLARFAQNYSAQKG